MKSCIKNLFLLPALIAGLGLIPAGRVTAQTVTLLHHFNGIDEANPYCDLILSGDTLYGTASFGGISPGFGTIFTLNTNGTGYTNLYSFTATDSSPPNSFTNSDGAYPYAGLILSGNTLYGTAAFGGTSGNGTVFKVNTDGAGFTTLHSFTATPDSTNSDGARPYAGVILSGNTLYGTTFQGGSSGNGTVFKLNTNGTGFTTLHSFTATQIGPLGSGTNSDGANPYAGLVLSNSILYGAAFVGGSSSFGTLFAVNTNGTGFTTLHSFDSFYGAYPYGGLILSDNILYGTTIAGGSHNSGIVFRIKTDATVFTNLYSFTGSEDGASPYAGLIISENILYGTTLGGGIHPGIGTVFTLNTIGDDFTNLHRFMGPPGDGANPHAGLILSGNTLYGTALGGGTSGAGTVFSFSLPPPPRLTITLSDADVILTWPTNAAGFTLQSTTNLISTTIWETVSPAPTVVDGQNTVTNTISGTQQFYRLIQ